MVRVKFRYLVVNFLYPSPAPKSRTALPDLIQIHSPTPDAFNAGALVRLLRDAIEDLYGDYGSGMVSSVRYHLDTSTTNNCPCLRRSAVYKVNGDPVTGQPPAYQVEVQGVQNTNIFSAFAGGIAVGLPVTTATASGTTIAGVDTVKATLSLQASNVDPQTGQPPTTTLVTTVRINNCSQAAIGYKTSCN